VSANPFGGSFADLLEAQQKKKAERAERAESERLIEEQSEAIQTSQVPGASQVRETSQVTDPPAARSETRQVQEISQIQENRQLPQTSQIHETSQVGETTQHSRVDLFAGLPEADGYQRFSNRLYDHLLPQLPPFEQLVYLRLIRLSHGFGTTTCTVSYARLAEKTHLSESTVKRAVNELVRKRLVGKAGSVVGYQKEQGITFAVQIPTSKVSETRQVSRTRQLHGTRQVSETPIKEEHDKEKFKAPLYRIREIGAKLHERHRGEGSYGKADLREDVKRACAEQGIGYTDALIEEALKPLIS
jgi:DNA-binding Lrp family transcriptional regulator